MATTIGTESELVSLLKNLVMLDYDAIDAYQAAIDRLDDSVNRQQLTEYMADHQRHVENIGAHLKSLGETSPQEGDMKSYLTQGKVMLGGIMGDNAILKAMKTNEDDTNQAYSQALERADVPAEIRHTLENNLTDERRHRAWIEARLA